MVDAVAGAGTGGSGGIDRAQSACNAAAGPAANIASIPRPHPQRGSGHRRRPQQAAVLGRQPYPGHGRVRGDRTPHRHAGARCAPRSRSPCRPCPARNRSHHHQRHEGSMKNDASLFERALNGEKTATLPEGVDLCDFYAYMPQHNYIFVPTRELWPASSINSRLEPIPVVGPDGKPVVDGNGKEKTTPAATWLDRNRPVEQMTWVPGEPELILGRIIAEGGWIGRNGVACFNLYRAPTIIRGDAWKAGPWLDHIQRVFPDDTDHIVNWLAQ